MILYPFDSLFSILRGTRKHVLRKTQRFKIEKEASSKCAQEEQKKILCRHSNILRKGDREALHYKLQHIIVSKIAVGPWAIRKQNRDN